MSALRADLLERIAQNSPAFFEQMIVDLLVAMRYGGSHKNAAAQLGRSGDGGVDGVINEDRLGLDRVYVQAKRYAQTSTVGRPSPRMRLRWANSISTRLRSRRDCAKALVSASARAALRASSLKLRGILRSGALGQHRGFGGQGPQSEVLAR
jgi:hypothetical protein